MIIVMFPVALKKMSTLVVGSQYLLVVLHCKIYFLSIAGRWKVMILGSMGYLMVDLESLDLVWVI